MRGQIDSNITIGGVNFGSSSLARTANNVVNSDRELAAGSTAELTTRTDNDTGLLTVTAGHGLQSADLVDVYWDGGCRYGMTATVDVNAVTVDGGAGDNLPAGATDLVVCKQTVIDYPDVDGDNIIIIAAQCERRAHLDIRSESATVAAVDLAAGESWAWASDTGMDNPLASETITEIRVSLGDAENAATLYIGALVD